MTPAEYLRHISRRVEEAPCAIALPPRLRISACGPDTHRFLNGQMSNQMGKARPGLAIASCLLTIKGKIVSVPVCWRGAGPDVFILEVPATLGDATIQRLDRYLIADQVELSGEPAPQTWHLPGRQWEKRLPPGARAFSRFGITGWEVDGELPPQDATAVLREMEAEALRVANKIPGEDEFAAGVFPSEVGLDVTAVDFHKGCYLGQEVVSRLASVGKTRRSLVSWVADTAPSTGPALCAAPGERVIGQITTSLSLAGCGAAGLAVVREELAHPGSLLHAQGSEAPSHSTATIQIRS